MALQASCLPTIEPKTLRTALKTPQWFSTMKEELQEVKKNNTSTLIP